MLILLTQLSTRACENTNCRLLTVKMSNSEGSDFEAFTNADIKDATNRANDINLEDFQVETVRGRAHLFKQLPLDFMTRMNSIKKIIRHVITLVRENLYAREYQTARDKRWSPVIGKVRLMDLTACQPMDLTACQPIWLMLCRNELCLKKLLNICVN